MGDVRSARSAGSVAALSDVDFQRVALEVFLAVEVDHHFFCRCEGVGRLDGPRVTCGDRFRVLEELRRRGVGEAGREAVSAVHRVEVARWEREGLL